MQAGKLRHRVTIQSLNAGVDTVGQPVLTWSTFATVWGDIRYLNGLEALKADAQVPILRASIRIRRLDGVLPAMRAQHNGRTFEIKAVLPDPTGARSLDLAVEVING